MKTSDSLLSGKTVVKGIAMGKVQKIHNDLGELAKAYIPDSRVVEMDKFQSAKTDLMETQQAKVQTLLDGSHVKEIMEAHLMILDDLMLNQEIESNIEQGDGSVKGVLKAAETIAAMFAGLDDPYLRERAIDVRDVASQLVSSILGIKAFEVEDTSRILVAEDIEPSTMAGLDTSKVNGIVLASGSVTSHAVIIARSKGIPTIVCVDIGLIEEDGMVILDSQDGLILEPSQTQIAEMTEALNHDREQQNRYLADAQEKATTIDGKTITVAANISAGSDTMDFCDKGVEGVGLFRTEFLFMDRGTLPTEEDQFQAYKEAVQGCQGDLCVIRTLDIGGDKPLPSIQIDHEENPFLGYRAIRICLDQKDLFKTQLRSILRASAFGPTGIMVPYIISLEEILETKEILEELKNELKNEGIKYDDQITFGIMCETPSSVLMAPIFAKHVDFFSIGTNDLVQYLLAVDRGNQKIADLYDFYHPAVMRGIHQICEAAHEHGKWVGVCGEMGSDKKSILALLAFGVDELSMSCINIPEIKDYIRRIQLDQIDKQAVLNCTTSEEVVDLLRVYHRQVEELSMTW